MKKEALAVIILVFLILLSLISARETALTAERLTSLTESSRRFALAGRRLAADALLKAAGDELSELPALIYLPDSGLTSLQQSIYALRQSVAEAAPGLSAGYEALRQLIISELGRGSIFTPYFYLSAALKARP